MAERANRGWGRQPSPRVNQSRGDSSTVAVRLEAETLQALAGLERSRGRAAVAAELEESASRLFREIGAEPWGEQSRRRIEELVDPVG